MYLPREAFPAKRVTKQRAQSQLVLLLVQRICRRSTMVSYVPSTVPLYSFVCVYMFLLSLGNTEGKQKVGRLVTLLAEGWLCTKVM